MLDDTAMLMNEKISLESRVIRCHSHQIELLIETFTSSHLTHLTQMMKLREK